MTALKTKNRFSLSTKGSDSSGLNRTGSGNQIGPALRAFLFPEKVMYCRCYRDSYQLPAFASTASAAVIQGI